MKLFAKMAKLFRRLDLRSSDGWPGSAPSYSGENVNESAALALSAVWACVNLLSGVVGSLPLDVYRRGADGRSVLATDHSLHRILHDSPNADDTSVDFWEFVQAALELRGSFHARKDKIGGRLIGLTPIRVPVTPRRERDGRIWYRWTEDGKSFDLSEDDVFHIRGFGGSPLGGLSTLAVARQVFGLAIAIDKTAGGMFANGLRPSGVLKFKEFLTKEQRADAEQHMVSKFTGAMNAGRPMVLEGDAVWEALTINPEDAQMLQSRGFSVEEICRFFGVPPFMIGHTEKVTSWGSGLGEQVLGFQKFPLTRRLRRIEKAIEKQLLTAADRAAGVFVKFNMEGLLRGAPDARAAFYSSGLQNGWLTINEVREKEDLPPVEGGDVPRMQSQNIPITQAAKIGDNGGPPLEDAA